ncbi:GGDEF domain-containing protein [Arcobacter arenosus]|uniref:diguanylate cyclase n=1 Tax=Arcobacter arenosus TaxID=2576037 RepID=A0A5R8XWR6_9BACT|nr:GGDEF domain-containing protein [Arcobacter arenosus]TLP35173.1 GGDEF domain-containing protein [Arcobacter arenosus]
MKTTNTYFNSEHELLEFAKKENICDDEKLLIQIFTSKNNFEFIKKLLSIFTKHFPKSTLIGSTTDGEICNGKVSTKKTVISFTTFEKTNLEIYISNKFKDYFEGGKNLAKSLIKDDTKVIISFIDGLRGNGEDFLNGINSVNNNIIISGGLAGDNSEFKKTYVFTKDTILFDGVVGVALNSNNLKIFTDYSFDWQAIGKKLTITHAIGNRVFTIEDKTAVEAYNYYLGEAVSEKLPKVGIEFPLIIQNNDLNIARAVIGKEDDGSLIFAGNLKISDKVRFGCADFDSIFNETQKHVDKLLGTCVESIFIYSCMARRRFIPEAIESETSVYNKIAPSSGFYTYGEFFSCGRSKLLLNQSMTVLALSESSICKQNRVEFQALKHSKLTLQALSHLINVSTKELDILQNKLEFQNQTDPLTKLYNRRYFSEVSNNLFKISHRDFKPLSIVMIDIDNFKNINDTYGHSIGDRVIIKLAKTLFRLKRESDITCRYGGEEFIMLLPNTSIRGASVYSEKIRKKVEDTTVEIEEEITITFTISLGVTQIDFINDKNIETVINRADEALYKAKKEGRNQVVSL